MEKPTNYRISPNVIQFPSKRGMQLDGEITPYLSSETSTSTPATGNVILLVAHLVQLRRHTTESQATPNREMQQAGITLASYHVERGARTFAEYAQAMVADLGDSIKPYLKSWYLGVKYDPRVGEFDGMSTAAEVEADDLAAYTVLC